MCLSATALVVIATAAAQPVSVRVENPSSFSRADEVVALDWAELRARGASLAEGNVRVRVNGGREVLSQLIDQDGDGIIDELLFLADLGAMESRTFVVEAAPASLGATDVAGLSARAFVMHDDYRDDVAWENDRVAFRTYGKGLWQVPEFDPLVSSGIDVWMKRTRDLVVARWYQKGAEAYHIDTGEGADYYSVGPTLGNGGTAVWQDGQIYRAENFAGHRILANGPIRAVFELYYDPWQAGDTEVSEVKRVTIDAGKHLFRTESTFATAADPASGSEGAPAVTAVVGFVKRQGVVGSTKQVNPEWAWISTWGPVQRGTGGHGDLGGAALLDRRRLLDIRETEDHYIALLTAQRGEPLVQYVGAGWTAAGDITSVADWWRYLDAFAERLVSPVVVTIEPSSR